MEEFGGTPTAKCKEGGSASVRMWDCVMGMMYVLGVMHRIQRRTMLLTLPFPKAQRRCGYGSRVHPIDKSCSRSTLRHHAATPSAHHRFHQSPSTQLMPLDWLCYILSCKQFPHI